MRFEAVPGSSRCRCLGVLVTISDVDQQRTGTRNVIPSTIHIDVGYSGKHDI